MTSAEYKELAQGDTRDNELAFVHMLKKGGYVFIQWSDSEECWDYYIYDEDREYIDGGQFESGTDEPDAAPLPTAYEALKSLLYDEYGIYDIDDEEEVEFLDPEEGAELDA